MIDAGIEGLLLVLTPDTMLMILVGIVVGFIIGVLPGLGGTVGMGLLLPFTFAMDPVAAFALLLTVATVCANASDITSIIYGIPGDGASAALVLDGREMARAGEAERALAGNLVASMVGALIGVAALVVILPFVRPVVLSFGSPEFLMLTVLGLTFIGGLSSGHVLAGFASALLGIVIGTIGIDGFSGVHRYTFGRMELWSGLGIVPVALGLFAIPELYKLVRSTSVYPVGDTGLDETTSDRSQTRQGILDVVHYRWVVIRCSLIGVFVGILPGLGASVSQWMAYGHAYQTSKDPARFGKGAIDGALGPGATNNSGLGGTLVPTVAFGVPGSVVTAILLGGFLIHGLVPGPEMLTTKLPLTMSFVWTIVIANLIAVAIFLPSVRHLARVANIRSALLVPVLIIAVVFGAFASSGRLFAVYMMLAVGLVATMMVRLNWPRAPFILGVVLGPLMEGYLRLSYSRYEFTFLRRPVVLILLGACVLVVLAAIRSQRRARDAERPAPEQALAEATSRPAALWQRIAFSAGVLVVGASIIVGSRGWRTEAWLLPRISAGLLVIVVTLLLIRHIRMMAAGTALSDAVSHLGMPAPEDPISADLKLSDSDLGQVLTASSAPGETATAVETDPVVESVAERSPWVAVGWLVGTAVLVWAFGFAVGAVALSLLYAAATERRTAPWVSVVVTGAGLVGFFFLADRFMSLRFPTGFFL